MKLLTTVLPLAAITTAFVLPDEQVMKQIAIERQPQSYFDQFKGSVEDVWSSVDDTFKDAVAFSENALDSLSSIYRAAHQMEELIDDLLAFARVSQVEMKKTEVDLDQLVAETVRGFEADTKGRGITWQIHALPPILADRALLRLALVNLVSNAVKFTGVRAQAKIEIGCTLDDTDGTVIYIRDNGAGFDAKYATRLFGVFQRMHTQEEFEGTGIGLANVQRIIQRHGGRIWAEGVVDGGATFYFSVAPQPVKA